MSTQPPESNIYLFPSTPIVIEVHSQKLLDLTHAITMAGFVIKNTGKPNRFRVEDAKEKK